MHTCCREGLGTTNGRNRVVCIVLLWTAPPMGAIDLAGQHSRENVGLATFSRAQEY